MLQQYASPDPAPQEEMMSGRGAAVISYACLATGLLFYLPIIINMNEPG